MRRKNFESSLARLEEILDLMENERPSLKETLELYKEGAGLSAFCMSELNKAEEEVTVLRRTAEGVFEQTPLGAAEDMYGE